MLYGENVVSVFLQIVFVFMCLNVVAIAMRKLICFLFLLQVSLVVGAQELAGTLDGLAQEGKARLVVDFSEAVIHGMSEQEFAQYERKWYRDKPIVVGEFHSEFADELDGLLLCNSVIKSPYTIVVKYYSINSKGDTSLSLHVLEKISDGQETEVAVINGIKEDGGTFGTKIALIKDGARNVGEKAGKILKKHLKRAVKKK